MNTEVSSLRSLLSSSSAALQTDFSEARSVADSGHQQVADYKKSCEDAVRSELGAVAAKHCHLEGLFHHLYGKDSLPYPPLSSHITIS